MNVRLVFDSSKQILIYYAEQNVIEYRLQRSFVPELQRKERSETNMKLDSRQRELNLHQNMHTLVSMHDVVIDN